jgi:hypothetical protein
MIRRHIAAPTAFAALLLLGLLISTPTLARDGSRPFAIGVGAGVVEQGNEEEPFYTLNVRFPVRRGGGNGKSAYRFYLEPEVGFWDTSEPFGRDDSLEAEMSNIGLNFLALARGRRIESWIGLGIGVYFEDLTIRGGGVGVVRDESETNIGGNLQVGIDINFGRRFAIFGVGRLDLIDSDFFDEQTKLYLGLRFRFGG